MAYGYGNEAKEPKGVEKREMEGKKAPAMPKPGKSSMEYSGGKSSEAVCYTHGRKSHQK